MDTTVGRGEKWGDAIYFDFYHSMPDIPETLHEGTVSTAYGLLVKYVPCSIWFPQSHFFSMVRRPLSGPDLITTEVSRSHPDTHTHTHTHTHAYTLGRTPLNEWWACRRDLYLATHNTYKRKAPMPPVGFEPAIPASEQSQTHALRQWDRLVAHNLCH